MERFDMTCHAEIHLRPAMADVLAAVRQEGHMILIRHGVTFAIGIIGVFLSAGAQEVTAGEVGVITFVQGAVTLTHSQAPAAPAKFHDDVQFHDIIETQKESRTKALFLDDSVLTVGEHSRIEITEFVFNPHDSMRSAIVNLVGGKLRALVGKAFAESGSRFEIHTPTAVAAARGTYFVVWLDEKGRTGVANIGEHGRVEFTSHGATVIVQAGEFSEERDDGPTVPVSFRMKGGKVFAEGPADVNTLVFLKYTIVDTDVRESLRVEIHGESMFSRGIGRPVGLLTSPLSLPGGGALTPPAVISGAAGLRGAGAVIGGGNTPGGGVPPGGPPIVTGPIVLPPPRAGGNHGTP
jgi:hypothetical protein